MGKAAYDAHPEARDVYAAADEALGVALSTLCFDGPEETLTDTINAQPAILATSIAYLRVFRASGQAPEPAYVAGHSLGEYTALVAAGALSLEEGVKLVRERGRLMKEAGEANPGMMAAIIGLDTDVVEDICAEASGQGELNSVRIANYNCPGQLVISGMVQAVERAVELASERKARRAIPLAVSIASHSPLMASAVPGLRQAVNGLSMGSCSVPLVANVSALPIETPEAIGDELVAQLTSSVRWTESIEYLIGQGIADYFEIGPKTVLSGLMRRISREVSMTGVEAELGLA
jgi:[acyl-carrier-protein] S-malonyltransferase